MRAQMFSGALPMAVPGEVVFQSAGASNSQTVFNWVVPAGVYEVCLLGVSSHRAYATRISRGNTDLLNTTWVSGTNNTYGGDGGDATNGDTVYNAGGGAGGYAGSGGRGAYAIGDGYGGYYMRAGTAGQGGGGGGGGGSIASSLGKGGPVGIYGMGADGAAGSIYKSSDQGRAGSDGGSTRAGAGTLHAEDSAAGSTGAKPGGNLRYRNAVQVSPGEMLTITLDYWIRDRATGSGAVVRILWGGSRAFPANAPVTAGAG
ncbi:hypothetical protein AVXHC19_36630 [Acidovorax sacchari]